MKVAEDRDGRYILVSNGSGVENCAVAVLIEMLSRCELPDDIFNNSFGVKMQQKKPCNYIYIPSMEIINIEDDN